MFMLHCTSNIYLCIFISDAQKRYILSKQSKGCMQKMRESGVQWSFRENTIKEGRHNRQTSLQSNYILFLSAAAAEQEHIE